MARFDFRSEELQSSFFDDEGQGVRVNCNGKGGFMRKATCRRGSNENLLNFEQRGHYSACKKFDYVDSNEEL